MNAQEQVEQAAQPNPYETESCLLVPYEESLFREEFMVELYALCKKDGLLPVFFTSGEMYLNKFIRLFSGKPFVIAIDKSNKNVIGIGWMNEIEGQDGCRKGNVGFGFFREYWGKQIVREAGYLAVKWWFEGLNIDVLFGSMMDSNRVAIKFSEQIGFTTVAVIPNFLITDSGFKDARLVTLTKEQFNSSGGATNGWSER